MKNNSNFENQLPNMPTSNPKAGAAPGEAYAQERQDTADQLPTELTQVYAYVIFENNFSHLKWISIFCDKLVRQSFVRFVIW